VNSTRSSNARPWNRVRRLPFRCPPHRSSLQRRPSTDTEVTVRGMTTATPAITSASRSCEIFSI